MKFALLVLSFFVVESAKAGHLEGVPPAEQQRKPAPAVLKQVAPDLYFFYKRRLLQLGLPRHRRRRAGGRHRAAPGRGPRAARAHPRGHREAGEVGDQHACARRSLFRQPGFQERRRFPYETARRQAYFKRQKLDPAEVALVLPDIAYGSSLTLTLGNRSVQVQYMGPGQNPGDTLVHFPHARALFVGGPFARRNWSNTSFTPSVNGWIALLEGIAAMDVDTYLPGHGDVGTRRDVLDEAKLLTDFQAGVKSALAKGMSKEEMVRSLSFPQYSDLRNYHLLHGFIEALHHLYTTGKPAVALP